MELEMKKCGEVRWAEMKKGERCESMESSSSSLSDSEGSSSSSLSGEDDAITSPSSSSSSSLFEFADLMAQLPIKRGLSKYYNGKSESFASLMSVESVEDLEKKESLYSRRMKASKSYGSNLNRHSLSPKATIVKRPSPKTFSPKPTNTMAVN